MPFTMPALWNLLWTMVSKADELPSRSRMDPCGPEALRVPVPESRDGGGGPP